MYGTVKSSFGQECKSPSKTCDACSSCTQYGQSAPKEPMKSLPIVSQYKYSSSREFIGPYKVPWEILASYNSPQHS